VSVRESLEDPINEKAVSERVRADCPQVRWLANYTILGP